MNEVCPTKHMDDRTPGEAGVCVTCRTRPIHTRICFPPGAYLLKPDFNPPLFCPIRTQIIRADQPFDRRKAFPAQITEVFSRIRS